MTWLVLLTLFPVRQDAPSKQATSLAEQLRSDSVDERNAAARALKGLGKDATAALLPLASDADAEVAARARQLLRVLKVLEVLPAALPKSLPGVDERLAAGPEQLWAEVFIEAAGDTDDGTRRRHPELKREDLEILARRAFLADPEPERKAKMCKIVGARWFRAAIPDLLPLLSDPAYGVREEAVIAVGKLRAHEAVPGLLLILRNEKEGQGVRGEAIRALSRLKAREAVPEITQQLKIESGSVLWEVRWALDELRAREAIPTLVELLKDRVPSTRAFAATILAEMVATEAVPALLPLLQDKDRSAKACAAEALGHLGAQETAPDLMKLLEDRDAGLRRGAASGLCALGHAAAVPKLVRLLKDPDFNTGWAVARALGSMSAPEATEPLLALLRDENTDVRSRAAEALAESGVRESIPRLRELLKDRNGSVRWHAAQALRTLGAREAWSDLVPLLEDADYVARGVAALALATLDAREAAPDLLRMLDDPKRCRNDTIEALGRLGVVEAVPKILPFLDGPDESFRDSAAAALRRLRARDALPKAAALLEDPSHRTRIAAASWLCESGSAKGVPVLLEEWAPLTPLNALRDAKAWTAAVSVPLRTPLEGSGRLFLAEIARRLGLQLDLRPPQNGEETAWLARRPRGFPPRTMAEAFETVARGPYELILDGATMKVVTHDEALTFWRGWKDGRAK